MGFKEFSVSLTLGTRKYKYLPTAIKLTTGTKRNVVLECLSAATKSRFKLNWIKLISAPSKV
jgi:hypothetical protein